MPVAASSMKYSIMNWSLMLMTQVQTMVGIRGMEYLSMVAVVWRFMEEMWK